MTPNERKAGRSARVASAALLFFTLLPLARPAVSSAAEPSRDFARLWTEAGTDERKKAEVIDALAREGSGEAAKVLVSVALMPAEPAPVVQRAIDGLSRLEGKPGDRWLADELRRSGSKVPDRVIIARAIGRRSTPEARAVLFGAARDKAWQVQVTAIEALRRHRDRETVELLLELWSTLDGSKDESGRVGADLREALLVLTGKDFVTAADARSWWSAHGADWKPDAASKEPFESREAVTEERVPRLFDEVLSRRVLLVLDTSGSMQITTGAEKTKSNPAGLTRFEVMRREVRRVIEELPVDSSFNLVTFADKVLTWKPKLLEASGANKRHALKFVDSLNATGGTNSHGALEQVFKIADADTVYFLSDGYPTTGRTDFNVILAEVQKWNTVRNLRIHTIAFVAGDGKPLKIEEGDKSLPKEFMRRLAQENRGHYRLVE